METNNTEKIKVSTEFIEAYQLFNVNSQVDKIDQLSRRERLLLFTLAIDSYSEDSAVAIENFRPYKEDLDLIYALQNDDTVTDADLLYLSDATGEKYIDTSNIIDQDGNKLPSATTEEEARIKRRDLGISQIFDGE
jgi:hypothetical protein